MYNFYHQPYRRTLFPCFHGNEASRDIREGMNNHQGRGRDGLSRDLY